MNREQIKEKMVSAMDLPKDVIQNASVITILGRNDYALKIIGALLNTQMH